MDDEKGELRIKQVQALDLFRRQREKIDFTRANCGGRAFMRRRKNADLAEHGAGADVRADFLQPDGSALQVEEFLAGIAFAKNDRVPGQVPDGW